MPKLYLGKRGATDTDRSTVTQDFKNISGFGGLHVERYTDATVTNIKSINVRNHTVRGSFALLRLGYGSKLTVGAGGTAETLAIDYNGQLALALAAAASPTSTDPTVSAFNINSNFSLASGELRIDNLQPGVNQVDLNIEGDLSIRAAEYYYNAAAIRSRYSEIRNQIVLSSSAALRGASTTFTLMLNFNFKGDVNIRTAPKIGSAGQIVEAAFTRLNGGTQRMVIAALQNVVDVVGEGRVAALFRQRKNVVISFTDTNNLGDDPTAYSTITFTITGGSSAGLSDLAGASQMSAMLSPDTFGLMGDSMVRNQHIAMFGVLDEATVVMGPDQQIQQGSFKPWVSLFNRSQHRSLSVSDSELETNLGVAGIGLSLTQHSIVGIFSGRNESKIEQKVNHVTAKQNYQGSTFGIYGSHTYGAWQFSGLMSYMGGEVTHVRSGGGSGASQLTAGAEFDVDMNTFQGRVSYLLERNYRGFSLSPTVSLSYVSLVHESIHENVVVNGEALAMEVFGTDHQQMVAEAGMNMVRQSGHTSNQFSFGVRQNLFDEDYAESSMVTAGNRFSSTVDAPNSSRTSGYLRASSIWQFAAHSRIETYFDAQSDFSGYDSIAGGVAVNHSF